MAWDESQRARPGLRDPGPGTRSTVARAPISASSSATTDFLAVASQCPPAAYSSTPSGRRSKTASDAQDEPSSAVITASVPTPCAAFVASAVAARAAASATVRTEEEDESALETIMRTACGSTALLEIARVSESLLRISSATKVNAAADAVECSTEVPAPLMQRRCSRRTTTALGCSSIAARAAGDCKRDDSASLPAKRGGR
jgi:hypothetical protein